MHPGVQHRAQSFRHHRTHARKSLRDRIRAQQQHGARFVLAERCAHTARVAAHQVDLQFANLLARNTHRSHFPEAGVDAIHGVVRRNQPLDHRARRQHPFLRLRSQLHFRAFENHAVKLREIEMFAVKLNCAHKCAGFPSRECAVSFRAGKYLRYFSGNDFGRPCLSQKTCNVSPVASTSRDS